MTKTIKIIISVILLFLFNSNISFSKDIEVNWNNSNIKWFDYYKGIESVKKTKSPALIVFYTNWCPHCKQYSKVFKNSKIVNLSKKFVMIKVNTDKNPKISELYLPDGEYIPRTIFLNNDLKPMYNFHADRNEYAFFINYENEKELEELMKKVLDSRK